MKIDLTRLRQAVTLATLRRDTCKREFDAVTARLERREQALADAKAELQEAERLNGVDHQA